MPNLRQPGATERVSIASSVFALALPPPSYGLVPSWWSSDRSGVIPEFELEIWANAAINLTGAELYGAALHPLVVADDVFTAAATDIVTAVAHGLLTGDGPFRVSSDTTLPPGLAVATDYWIIRLDNDTYKLAASLTDALSGTPVNITGAGAGVHTIVDTADTQRVHWHSHGLLGPAEDGAIALTNQRAYLTTRKHSARAIAYAVVATLDVSDPEAVSAAFWPRSDSR